MSEILRKFKWILFFLIPLFFETNTANAESHSVWLDSTFTKYQIDVNPYFLQEHLNGLNSVETGDSLDFSYVFSGLNPESRVYVYQMNGDSITSIRVGDSVFFYMPDEDVFLSIKNPVYEIIYDSDYIDYFDGYNNPTAVEAGSIVNIVFKKGIIPGGTQQLWGGWYIFDGITVHDSVASFVMPYGNVKLTAARMTDLEIMDNIQCEGGTLRHSETGNAGDTIFFNACPDKGYYIRTIYVSSSEDFKKLDDTTYSFVMLPNLPVWINVCFEKVPTHHSITIDGSCKEKMDEYGSVYLTAEGYSHGYQINTHSTIDSVEKGVRVTLAHFKDLSQKSLVKVRTESGKTVEYETVTEFDSIWFAMPNENIYISMEEDQTPYYTITVDASCKEKMDEYGSVYLTAGGYSHGYRVNTHSTIDSVEKGVRVTLAHFKDLSQKSLVKVRTESGKTVEYETVSELDSIWFFMPNENIYISMEEAATKVNIDTIVICGKGWISAPTSGNAKDTIWFSVHPAVGYHVQSVEVSGNTPIHLWDDTTYIFKLVAGKDVQITVCFAIDMICGCTDPAALNYDSLATVRDNSCIYPTVIYGCTDPKALNYDPEATHNSGLCEYVKEIGGCTDASALNYDSLATYNDGSCQYPREIIHGCTDTFALNYNPYAEIDNNTCEYRTVSDTIVGCMDAKAINYNPLASVNSECIYEKVDSVIVVEGCTDPKAANYNEKATKEDGSCVYANPISTYNAVADVVVNTNQEVVVVVDTVKSIGVVETNGCEINFAEKIDSVNVKVLSYIGDELITNWEVYQSGNVIYYDNVTVTCTEKDFVVLNLSLICNKNMRKPSGLRAKSTMVYAATLRSLVDLRDFGTTTIVLDENVASLYVYPNPASEIIYVEAPSLKDKTLQMVNLNGEVVKVVKANSNKLQIAVGDLSAGAYLLFSQDGSVSETVIIK